LPRYRARSPSSSISAPLINAPETNSLLLMSLKSCLN
jgi:hypothetical protein